MPIEFRCTQCAKLLRTGDDTAGKKARCPGCQTILTVPSGEQPPPRQAPPPQPESGAGENPFASGYAGQGYASQGPQPDSGNPYQAPGEYAMQTDYHAVGASGEIRPSSIGFGETFSRTWAAFTDQLGMCVLVAFLCLAMKLFALLGVYGLAIITMVVSEEVAMAAVVFFILLLPAACFVIWIGIGESIFYLKVARGQEAEISEIFSGAPYFLRIFGTNVLLQAGWLFVALIVGVTVFFALAGGGLEFARHIEIATNLGSLGAHFVFIFVMLIFFQYYYLIIDRNMGVFEALGASREIMSGNKLIAFFVFLVVFLLGGLFGICTCYVGFLFFIPYMGILYAILYLTATGQPTMSDYRDLQYQQQVQPQPGQQ